MLTSTDPAGSDDLAQLRRRLYQPSASDDDVQRYRAAVAAVPPAPPAPPVRRGRRDGRTIAVRVAVPAGVAATALLLGAIVATSTPPRTPTPDPVPTVGLAEQRGTTGPYSFQQAADSTEPLSLTTTVTDAGVWSYTGVGPGTIAIDRSKLSFHGGVVRVAMLTATAAPVGWQIDRIETRADWSSYDHTLARGSAAQEMAPVTPVQFEYTGAPPMTIQVHAPVGTRWWLDLRIPERS